MIKAIIFDLGNTLLVEENRTRVELFPEVQQVLKILKEKYKLALITNVPSTITAEYVNDALREVGIHVLFDVIIVSSDVGINKPDEEVF